MVTIPGAVVTTPVAASNGVPPAFKSAWDLAFDGNRTIFIADTENNVVRAVDTMTNAVSVFAGNGVNDEVDNATGTSAAIDAPVGVVVDRTRHILYVSDWGGGTIRAVDLSNASHPVSTVAGSGGNTGFVNGTFAKARFWGPRELAYDSAANVLYVSDEGNNAVRKVDLVGKMVTTYVGDGTETMQLGPLPGKINSPSGLAVTPRGLVIATAAENALLLAH
jgi:DNA-binding beta-propeller fold protein YncE